mmetsp:Transcript_8871/g.32752  ORF Transcript_8871/g.32752 Transcript_8871/m.32752 type:complete len:571 (-) Transcript_8871:65-1777(-)|eukprot:CAMPEP_0117446858 /NCGR_PEP_ID=MMETSP0759-20121206/6566_1 /TAXON_ID=63605 /ORGANISM="Percolomonas cosmopolitus, Strain WS" /LENGTH=570 /DNA_ID=CAMNT_0005239155 /DNA_START=155 /DNA_END=1867 /DNA_ORIENTATION=+
MPSTPLIDEFLRSYLEKSQSYNLEPHPRIIDAISSCRKEMVHFDRGSAGSDSGGFQMDDANGASVGPQLRALVINGNESQNFTSRLKDVDIFALAECLEAYPSLIQALDLRYHQIGNACLEALNKVIVSTELLYLNLKGNNIKSIRKLIANMETSKLKSLDISENPVEDLMVLAESLENNTTIASLNVSSVDSLRTKELIRFAIQLRNHPLKVFRANRPQMPKLAHEVIIHLSEMLRLNHTLRILELSQCALTCHDMQLLIEHGILLNNKRSTLRVLNVSGNHIGCDGALWVGRWLQNNRCELQQLNLAFNRIGLVGGSHLADALAENHTLKSLDLSHCPLGDNALYEISRSLGEANTSLQSIALKGCKFDQRSMKSFYELQHVIRAKGDDSVPTLNMDLLACKSPNTKGVDVYYMAERNQAPSTKQPSFLGAQNHPVLDSPNILDLLNEYELFDENEIEYLKEIHRQHGGEPGSEQYPHDEGEYYGEDEQYGEDERYADDQYYDEHQVERGYDNRQQYEQYGEVYGEEEDYGERYGDDEQHDEQQYAAQQGRYQQYEDDFGEHDGEDGH